MSEQSETGSKNTYKLGQDNITPLGLDLHNPVFLISGLSIIAFVIVTLMFQEGATQFFGWLRPFLTSTFDWFFLLSANLFVLFCLYLMLSPLGKIRLGGGRREAGLQLHGLDRHVVRSRHGHWFDVLRRLRTDVPLRLLNGWGRWWRTGCALTGRRWGRPAGDIEAARDLGMAATIFHWALHPWAIYAVVALALAFFTYNRNLPLTLRSAFYPLFGERVWGWTGHIIDTLAVFATLFGLATSLGFGTIQALGGLNYLFDVPTGNVAKVVLIAVITAAALISVLRGLDGGVKVLSEINIALAALLVAFVIFVGPTLTIFETILNGGIAYVKELVPLSMPFGREDANFSQGWTSFYWAWWISWSPFVGMFIARVSRGRTVREFVFLRHHLAVHRQRVVDGSLRRHRHLSSCGRRGGPSQPSGAGTKAVRDAEATAVRLLHFVARHRPGDRVLRHLVGLGLSGDRHHHRRPARPTLRWRSASSGAPSKVWWRRRCAAGRRRPEHDRPAGHVGLHRLPVHHIAAGHVREPADRAARGG